MKKTTVQILKDAKQLLIDKGWVQSDYAQDASGACVRPDSEAATCFCGWGATFAATGPGSYLSYDPAQVAAEEALNAVSGGHFPAFNDAPARTLDEVLVKFDEAIAYVEAAIAQGKAA